MPSILNKTKSFLPWSVIFVSVVAAIALTVAGDYLLKGDIVETLHMGRDMQIFYPKHPPVTFWFSGFLLALFSTDILLFVTMVTLYTGYAFVVYMSWRFSSLYFSQFRTKVIVSAAIGLSLFAKYIYFTPDFAMLVLTSPVLWFFYRAIKFDYLRDWLLVAILSLLLFFSKYQAVVTLTTMFLVMVSTEHGRRRFRSMHFWLAVLLCAAVLVPYVVHMLTGEIKAVSYARAGAGMADSFHLGGAFSSIPSVAFLPILLAIVFFSRQHLEEGWKNFKSELKGWSFEVSFLVINSVGYWLVWFVFCLIFQHELQARFLILNIIPLTLLFTLIFKPSIERIGDKGIKATFAILVPVGVLAFAENVYRDNNWQETNLYQQASDVIHRDIGRPVDYIVEGYRSFDNFYLSFPEKPRFRTLTYLDEKEAVEEVKEGTVLFLWRLSDGKNPEWVQRIRSSMPQLSSVRSVRLKTEKSKLLGVSFKEASLEFFYAFSSSVQAGSANL